MSSPLTLKTLMLCLDLKNKIKKGSLRSRIKSMQLRLGGYREGRGLNITSFPLDLRFLAYIMMFNLYPVKKLSTINNAKAIFLMELRENTYIDIGAHLYNIIVESTKTTSRSKLVVPNFILRILHNKGVETPQHIGLMDPTPPIDSQTILRSRIWISGDDHAEETEEAPSTDTKTEVEGQQHLPTHGGGRRRRGASSSSSVPPDAFQIILERIDGFSDAADEHSNRLVDIQDQINVLVAKFDSFTHQL